MEKYIKLSDVIEELDELVRTKQIEPISINLDQIEEKLKKRSIKSSVGFKGAMRIVQRLKNEYNNIHEHGHHNVNKLYIEAMLGVLDEIEDEFKELKEDKITEYVDMQLKTIEQELFYGSELNTDWRLGKKDAYLEIKKYITE